MSQNDQPLAAVPVGRVSGRDRQQDHGQHLHQAHHSQRQWGTRPLIQLPADGDPLHLIADRRHHPGEHQAPKVGIAENRVRVMRDEAPGTLVRSLADKRFRFRPVGS